MDIGGPHGGFSKKSDIVHQLKELMSANKKDLDKGAVPLCLTPEVLLILNHGFERLTDTRNGDEKIFRDLGYLQHAITSTQFLRLSHGGSATIQAPVDLSTFHQLSQLDIKRIPPHWIVGLNKFQNKLVLIRVSRSINFLEDLLGKSSEPDKLRLAWSRLRKLYLSNNFIKELDDSLKLLPSLELLDLSQNYLSDTDPHLLNLSELVHLNLAYNSLSSIPAFSPSTCQKLKTLVLRANHLEQINGIELLVNLESLDLTSNILCDHAILIPLSSITTLKKLYLEDNPLSYNGRHRVLTGAILYPKVVKQLTLDGERFSEHEIRSAMVLRSNIRPTPEGSSEPNSRSGSYPESSGLPRVVRRIKSTVVDNIEELPEPVDDVVDGAAADSMLAVDGSQTSDRPSATKSRIETMREEFGDTWLQSLSGYYVPSARPAQRQEKTERLEAEQLVAAASSQPITVSGGDDGVSNVDPQSQYGSLMEGADVDMKYGSVEDPASRYGSVTDGDEYLTESRYSSARESSDNGTDSESVFSTEDNDVLEASDQFEHDPFIVKLPTVDAEEFLITVSKKQIIEKNIEGLILEMLDLSALIDIQPFEKNGKQMVKCKFDYFRKDRRERCYVMEDLNDSMRLVDILQPMVAVSQSTRRLTGTIECLKCGKQFTIKKNSRKGVRIDCVHCGSDMVIELNLAPNSQSTPCSSLNSSPSPSPGKPKTKLHELTQNSESSNSIYVSANEEELPSSNTKIGVSEGRERSGTDTTDSTIQRGSDDAPPSSDDTLDSDYEDNEVLERPAAVDIKLAAGTPDTLSYQSLSNESDTSALVDYQPGHHHETDPLTGFKFDPTDLAYMDHRLKLHLTVSYFEENEQPQCVVRCKCVEYTRPEEYPAVLVLTSSHFYLFRVHPTLTKRLDVGARLESIEQHPLSDIWYIEIGLAHQNIRVEFEKSGFCLLLRDFDLGRLLHTNLSMMMSNSSFNEESRLRSIAKINQVYYHHMALCLPDIRHSDDGEAVVASYATAFKLMDSVDVCNLDSMEGCYPVSLIVDCSSVYIVREAYHLPFTRNRLPKGHSYFTQDSTLPIGDIAHLHVSRERCEVSVEGFEEQAQELANRFAFVSPSSMTHFIDLVKAPWKDIYGVDMEIVHS